MKKFLRIFFAVAAAACVIGAVAAVCVKLFQKSPYAHILNPEDEFLPF